MTVAIDRGAHFFEGVIAAVDDLVFRLEVLPARAFGVVMRGTARYFGSGQQVTTRCLPIWLTAALLVTDVASQVRRLWGSRPPVRPMANSNVRICTNWRTASGTDGRRSSMLPD